jgi:hypothetical protein
VVDSHHGIEGVNPNKAVLVRGGLGSFNFVNGHLLFMPAEKKLDTIPPRLFRGSRFPSKAADRACEGGLTLSAGVQTRISHNTMLHCSFFPEKKLQSRKVATNCNVNTKNNINK